MERLFKMMIVALRAVTWLAAPAMVEKRVALATCDVPG